MAIYQRRWKDKKTGEWVTGKDWYIDFVYKGKRVRESIGPSRKSAEKVIRKKKTEIAENKYLDVRKDPDPIRFHDFCKEYLKWSLANKKPSALVRERCYAREFDKEFEGKTLQEITPWLIEKWKTRRKGEIKPASVNRALAVLKSLFGKAVQWGELKENPAKGIKLLKGGTRRLRYLMPDEVQTLLSNCNDYLRPIVTVAVHTGMRKGEVLGLRRDQVNFEQGVITLTDTKNDERRDVPMNETVKTALKEIEGNAPLFFPSSRREGEPYNWIYKSFETALKKSEIENFKFHDLRHTFASNLVMAGEDLNTVRELLGHKDLSMTLRYAHLSPNHKARAVSKLDQIMSQNPPQEKKAQKVVSLRS